MHDARSTPAAHGITASLDLRVLPIVAPLNFQLAKPVVFVAITQL